jgi:hypothetical protein
MHNIGGVLFGAFVGFWLGRALFVWVLDVARGVEIGAMIGCAVVGALIVVAAELSERETT